MTVIAVAVVLIIFILVFIYSLVRISSREDDLAEQEKYMKQLIEMKEKEERGNRMKGRKKTGKKFIAFALAVLTFAGIFSKIMYRQNLKI